MNRLKLIVLNNPAEIFTTYVTVADLINFLNRTGRPRIFSVLAIKGNRSLFIDRIENPLELEMELNDFAIQL